MLASPPENVDRFLWLYELCRLLVQKANSLIVGFFSDSPPCSSQNCPEMRASEWQYLCAVHDPPKSCCAIDYCCHTLDWAANVLTSPKHFPSRLTLGSEAAGGSSQGVRQLTNIFRRVYRMFAHAWFQHREVFWNVENHEGLYILYKTVCDVYNLIPEENYTVPPEAEGLDTKASYDSRQVSQARSPRSSIVRQGNTIDMPKEQDDGEMATTTISTGATTRRHKHTPSTGSFVTTIAEGDEEQPEHADRSVPLDNDTAARNDEKTDETDQASPVMLSTSPDESASTDHVATEQNHDGTIALADTVKELTLDDKDDTTELAGAIMSSSEGAETGKESTKESNSVESM